MKLIQLLENLQDFYPFQIDIDNGKFITEFPDKVNIFQCQYENGLTSLEGSPKEVKDFRCDNTDITSLEFCPSIIKGNFNCYNTKITSLDYAPLKVDGEFVCTDNKILHLKGIGRSYLKECKELWLPNTIKSNILGLCRVKKLKSIQIFEEGTIKFGDLYEALEIIKKYLNTDGSECQEELTQNGFNDYARF
jgi:hypothetical protein